MSNEFGPDGGWIASAPAWIAGMERGDPNRTLLLDPVMLDVAGDVRGKRVLDIGCGDGRFSRMLAERGADTIGLDLPALMVETAAAAGTPAVRGTGEALPFANERFDLVVAYLVLIDIPDFRSAISEAARVLKPGGRFIVAGIGNIASAANGWVRNDQGHRLYQQVDRYLEEREVVLEWSGLRIRNWHRPLSAYMDAYLDAGLQLLRYMEPMPGDDSLRDDQRYEDWYRVPNFDVMVWQKPGA